MIKGYFYSLVWLTSIALSLASCGEKDEELEFHTQEFNMISSVDNHAVIFSYDFMKLMDKSEVQNSEDMPIEVKMAMSLYIGNMLNSSNMGIRLEGNNHAVITTADNGEIEFCLFNC